MGQRGNVYSMKARAVLIAVAAAGAAATFLPWWAEDGGRSFDHVAATGNERAAWTSFGAFAVAFACGLYRPQPWVRALLVACAAVAIAVPLLQMRRMSEAAMAMASSPEVETRMAAVHLHPGHGIYLAIGGAIGVFFCALLWRRRSPGEQPPPNLPRAVLR